MRNVILFGLVLVSVVALLSVVRASDHPELADAPPALKVILATPESGKSWLVTNDHSHLDIILENDGDKPISLFDTWNSWGWYNVTLEWQTKDAKGTVKHAERDWTRNFPSVSEIPPGGALVKEVDLEKEWIGWPVHLGGQKITVHAVYESKEGGPGWQGSGWSSPITFEVRDNRPNSQ